MNESEWVMSPLEYAGYIMLTFIVLFAGYRIHKKFCRQRR